MKKRIVKIFDFKPIGLAIKSARESKGLSREKVAEIIGLTPRYYAKIENEGQYPSFHVLSILITLFQVPLDEFFLDNAAPNQTIKRRALDNHLDKLSDHELDIIEGTIKGILQAKKSGK